MCVLVGQCLKPRQYTFQPIPSHGFICKTSLGHKSYCNSFFYFFNTQSSFSISSSKYPNHPIPFKVKGLHPNLNFNYINLKLMLNVEETPIFILNLPVASCSCCALLSSSFSFLNCCSWCSVRAL